MSSTCKFSEFLLKRSVNPTILNLINNVLPLAENNGSQELIDSVVKSLELEVARIMFTDSVSTKHSETGAKIDASTYGMDWEKVYNEGKTSWNCPTEMISSGVTGQFLKSIVSAIGAKDILEIGMFTGYTAITMAEALPNDGRLVTMDLDQFFKDFVEDHIKDSPHKNKVEILIGDACQLMTKMSTHGQSFDLIFMDAAKEEYPAYLKLCLEGKLLRPNGLILADNAYFDGEGYLDKSSPSAKFAEIIKNDPSLHVVVVPIKDGISFIQRRVDVDGGIA